MLSRKLAVLLFLVLLTASGTSAPAEERIATEGQAPSTAPATPSSASRVRMMAERLATRQILTDIARMTSSIDPFAAPAPIELPIEFLVAWIAYDPSPKLFALQAENAQGMLGIIGRVNGNSNFPVGAEIGESVAADGSAETTEIRRATALTPARVSEILKAAEKLKAEANRVKAALAGHFEKTIAREPEKVKGIAAIKPASKALSDARTRVRQLVTEASKTGR